MDNHDIAFDPRDGDDSGERNVAPAAFVSQQDNDPAVLCEHAEWVGLEKENLTVALRGLDERSLDILTSRWLNEKKLTLHQLADRYSISPERIRQLEKNAMKKLRGVLAEG